MNEQSSADIGKAGKGCPEDSHQGATQSAVGKAGGGKIEKVAKSKHGLSKTPEYWAWFQMRKTARKNGVQVCERWLECLNFIADMGPKEGRALGLIDKLGAYEPGNAKWGLGRHKGLPVEVRFWKHVSKTEGCWEWSGLISVTGYGVLSIDGTPTKAHRVSYELHNGKIPEGMLICHKCDNRKCVRPDHLFCGTIADNNRDAFSKGRMPRKRPKLTEQIVRDMRSLGSSSMDSCRRFAAQYGTHWSVIYRAITRRTWRDVA